MLTKIKDLPDYIFGVTATGTVDADDLKQVLLPGLQEVSDRFGKIRYLLVLETEVKNFTTGAWIQDAKAGLQNFTNWERIAVVSAEKGVEWFTDVFKFFTPGTSKGFSPDELKEAKQWLTEN
ncbi:STAS/SEC14 domain-containing protein [Pedobacter sp. AW1-32]|uniref:STAS/SEC14 domain-containing protein n=1 Tax=Pedobacter sp. AW1-32 TaxID=3383026 RepID=UPI003FED85CD